MRLLKYSYVLAKNSTSRNACQEKFRNVGRDLCTKVQDNGKQSPPKKYYNDYINYDISIKQNVMQPSVITFMEHVNDLENTVLMI